MQRIRQKSSGTYGLTVGAYSGAGVAVTATTPALTAYDGADVKVLDAVTPTAALGSLSYAAAAASLGSLDTYALTWTGTVSTVSHEWPSTVEICGGYLYEHHELLAFDDAFTGRSQADLDAARTKAEVRFEQAAGVAFVPRCQREILVGDGTTRLRLTRPALRTIRSASIDGTALTADELAALVKREWGAVDRTDGLVWTADAEILICYEHGEDSPPEPVSLAAILLAQEYLAKRNIASRATSESTDVGFLRLSIAGRDRPTGIPEVDEVAKEFGRHAPRVW